MISKVRDNHSGSVFRYVDELPVIGLHTRAHAKLLAILESDANSSPRTHTQVIDSFKTEF